jgi:MoxR-like ATPase
VLIEDEPGVGKTLLARGLANAIGGSFGRVQGGPDLLPADITGVNAFNPATGTFQYHPGPLPRNVVLLDEINRATPRAQAALFEAMAEGQFTVDGRTWKLPVPFFVVATQNPREHAGVFPLPLGQLDRFALSLSIGPPDPSVERRLLDLPVGYAGADAVTAVASADELLEEQRTVATLHMAEPVARYLLGVVHELRQRVGGDAMPSPRASQVLAAVSRAWAHLAERDHVRPDDVQRMATPVLAHRLGQDPDHGGALVDAALEAVPAPTAP